HRRNASHGGWSTRWPTHHHHHFTGNPERAGARDVTCRCDDGTAHSSSGTTRSHWLRGERPRRERDGGAYGNGTHPSPGWRQRTVRCHSPRGWRLAGNDRSAWKSGRRREGVLTPDPRCRLNNEEGPERNAPAPLRYSAET